MQEIGKRFQLHPLVLEDILNTDQVSLVIGTNFVLSFQERPTGN